MKMIIQEPDGSYRWNCSIDTEYHRRSVKSGGIWGVLITCAAMLILFIFCIKSSGGSIKDDIWIPIIVIGTILLIALPLLYLMYSAKDPHEEYLMTEEFVKSGYGRAAVFSSFRKTKEVTMTEKYIELTGPHRTNRIYVPAEDMSFVREYILKRLPDDVVIRDIGNKPSAS